MPENNVIFLRKKIDGCNIGICCHVLAVSQKMIKPFAKKYSYIKKEKTEKIHFIEIIQRIVPFYGIKNAKDFQI